MQIEKLIKDGKVAVIYSPGYGAGWSTWNKKYEEFLVFDKTLCEFVLNNQKEKIQDYVKEKIPEDYMYLDTRDIEINWIEQGTLFEIDEYDGHETIVYLGSKTFLEA